MFHDKRWVGLLAPAMLITVAAGQLYAATQHTLSPWKGGGFGMFSTVDSPGNRFVRCVLVGKPRGEADAEPVEVFVPLPTSREYLDTLDQLKSWPDAATLQELADEFLSKNWYWVPRGFVAGANEAAPALNAGATAALLPAPTVVQLRRQEAERVGAERFTATGLRLEVWAFRWDWTNMRARTELLMSSSAGGGQ